MGEAQALLREALPVSIIVVYYNWKLQIFLHIYKLLQY